MILPRVRRRSNFKTARHRYFYKYYSILAVAVVSYLGGFVQDLVVTPQNAEMHGKTTVHDGDTIKVGNKNIRFYGIDAPELKQKCYSGETKFDCGIESRTKLTEIISGNDVFCSDLDIDKYGRTSGNCYFIDDSGAKVNIGQKLVFSGYALAYQTYSMRFVVNEWYAKISMAGIWQYQFQKPWEWRKKNKRR